MLDLYGYFPIILQGMGLTLQVAFSSLFIAVGLGMVGALAKLSRFAVARKMAGLYTTIIRGIPDLVMMTLIFYGGQILINDIGDRLHLPYIDISPFIAGVLTLGFIFGAYMTECFRGGILAVSGGEIEAGYAVGMTPVQVFLRITLPAMIRHALPGFGNNWMVLTKTTALVSVIGLQDMVYSANLAGGATRKPFTFFFAVALLFLLITGISDLGLRWATKKFSIGVRKV